MADGLVQPRTEGAPQGGPLSPLLSNILLTDLDRELERRGHTFCRYADDCNIYVASARAGVGLLHSLTAFLGDRLKLKVNHAKSAVARPWQRKFLGYSMTWHQQPKLRIAKPSLQKLTEKVRDELRGARGRKPVDVDLNLIPFIDVMSVLVAFLLLTAVWTNLAQINIKPGGVGHDAPPGGEPPINLSVV